MIYFRLKSALCHYYKSFRSKNGYGVHSPFAFYLITEVLNTKESSIYYCYDRIESLRYKLLKEDKRISQDGTETILTKSCQTSATSAKDCQLIFRIALFQNSQHILELGTSLGFGTAYLASTSSKAHITSIDHASEIQLLAKKNHHKLKLSNISYVLGNFDSHLAMVLEKMKEVDLAFFNNNHKGASTIKYFNSTLPYTNNKSVFIFHDIHRSKDIYQAWQEIYANQQVTASFELYNVGIVFFNKDLNKEHFYA